MLKADTEGLYKYRLVSSQGLQSLKVISISVSEIGHPSSHLPAGECITYELKVVIIYASYNTDIPVLFGGGFLGRINAVP